MNLQQLKQLGLSERWPKLKKHLEEVASLDNRVRESESQVQKLRAALPHAEQKDLDNAAAAVRDGKDVPHATNTDSAKRQLEAAERTKNIMARAAESARQDLNSFMAQHQQQLFEDVAQARAEIAREAAGAARTALGAFSKWSDIHYLLRDLAPPPEAPDYNKPAARLTQTVMGIHTTQSSGPARGDIEGALQHVISLGEEPAAPAAGTRAEDVA